MYSGGYFAVDPIVTAVPIGWSASSSYPGGVRVGCFNKGSTVATSLVFTLNKASLLPILLIGVDPIIVRSSLSTPSSALWNPKVKNVSAVDVSAFASAVPSKL